MERADHEKSLLVLDDEPDARDIVKLVFQPRGYRVYARGEGVEALELLRTKSIAVVLLDLLMPGMNGREFLQEVQSLDEAVRPVVIVNSARRAHEVKREIAGFDVFDIIYKPYELRAIEECVDRAFQEKVRRLAL